MLVVLLKEISEPKVQYVAARKLHELGVGTSFSETLGKIKKGQGIVIIRTESRMVAERHREMFEKLGANVEVTEQKTIGGKSVF